MESAQSAAKGLIKNTVFYLSSDAIITILSFIFNVYVVRTLGDERFGSYNIALSYAGIFSIIGDLGMTQYATREIARGRRKADELFWNIVIIRLILSLIATLFIVTSAYLIAGYSQTMIWGIFLVCLSYFLHAFFGPVVVILTGHERLDYGATLNTIVQMCFVTIGTLVLVAGLSFHALIIASYVGLPIATYIGYRYIKRLNLAAFDLKGRIQPGEWLSLIKYSIPFGVITFSIMATKDLDTVLLSLWATPEEVGWYKAAYNLSLRFLLVKTALIAALTPQMSRHFGFSKERVAQSFNISFKFLWATTLPLAIGISFVARPLILFLYTEEYAPSALVLAILMWSIPVLSLSSLCGGVTTATDKERQAVGVYILAALLNLGSNLVAIPIWGYLGATITTVITEVAALAMFYLVLHKDFPLKDVKNSIFKPIIAGVIMAIVLLLMTGYHMVFLALIGVATYSITLLLLNPFNETEKSIILGVWLLIRQRLSMSKTL